MDEIKSCKCGCAYTSYKEHLAWSIVGDERGIEYRIKCPICKLKVIGFGETVSVARERAVEAWNNMIED